MRSKRLHVHPLKGINGTARYFVCVCEYEITVIDADWIDENAALKV
jgi:hypothetical protein